MDYINYSFEPISTLRPIDGSKVTARGLHGLIFNILKQVNEEEATWLHQHRTPRPFHFVAVYGPDNTLQGIRLAAFTDRVADLLECAGSAFVASKRACSLGGQRFIIDRVMRHPGPTWQQMTQVVASRHLRLAFLSPTSFKQGPGHIPLPIPGNVFATPMRVWKAFAPALLMLPDGWLEWCHLNVFVTKHDIKTVEVQINKQARFTGFVGTATFEAQQSEEVYLIAWQALARVAEFCGTGHKTTMGMGATEII